MNRRPYELYIALDDIKPRWKANTSWENEAPLRAAFISLELYFLMIVDAHCDPRRTVDKPGRIARLWYSAALQMRLLGDTLTNTRPPESACATSPSKATNLRALRTVEHPARWVRPFVDGYDAVLDELPFLFGLEAEMQRLSMACGGRTSTYQAERARVSYDAWVEPEIIAEIFHRRTFNAEDRLFAATHQSIECWMFIALEALTAAKGSTASGDYGTATPLVERAAAIMNYLSGAITILETLVLADYHQLRVRLRDASGAQSRQMAEAIATCRQIGTRFATDLERRGLSYLSIYRNAGAHLVEHTFVEALTTLENRFALFLFNHYKLAARILGTGSLGSLGVEVQSLVAHFLEPLFPELDRVRYRYGIITSFAYGQHAGSLVTELEREDAASNRLPVAVEENCMREAIATYFVALSSMDIERWVSLFSMDGAIESPAGSRPYRGRQGLQTFFRNFMKIFEPNVVVTERAVRIDAPRGYAEVDWRIDVRHAGLPVTYEGTECFEFAASGDISKVTVHDDPRDIARQLLSSAELREAPLEK